MRILTDVNIDWLRWRWPALALSWLIILSGIGLMATRGVPLGIDFSGGTLVVVRFDQAVTEEAVRNALAALPGEKTVQRYGEAGENQIMIRLPQTSRDGGGGSDRAARHRRSSKPCRRQTSPRSRCSVPTWSDRSSAKIFSGRASTPTIASLVGIMAYIAFRFRLSFGLGAMTASIHDVLITMSLPGVRGL